jgi:polysaccharide biosynthesis/export protein
MFMSRDVWVDRMETTLALAMILLLASPRVAGWPRHGQQSTSKDIGSSSAQPVPDADPALPIAPGAPYTIGLGDVLRISVWREPELTSTAQVRSDGNISLPLLNDVQAVGSTPMQLAATLTDKLKRYVDQPRVTVIVSQSRPPIIYMVGQVGRHGPMALTPNMTVLQALVTAGLGTFANTKKIYVLRVDNGVEQRLPVNYKQLVKGKSVNQNIVLKPGDMVVVP